MADERVLLRPHHHYATVLIPSPHPSPLCPPPPSPPSLPHPSPLCPPPVTHCFVSAPAFHLNGLLGSRGLDKLLQGCLYVKAVLAQLKAGVVRQGEEGKGEVDTHAGCIPAYQVIPLQWMTTFLGHISHHSQVTTQRSPLTGHPLGSVYPHSQSQGSC